MRELLFYLSLPIIFGIGLKLPLWPLAVYLSANIIRPDALFWGDDTAVIIFRVSAGATIIGFVMGKESKSEPLTVREWWLLLWICLAMNVSVLLAYLPPDPRVWDYIGDAYRALIIYWLILGILQEKRQALQLVDIWLLTTALFSLWGWEQHFGGNPDLEGLGGQGDRNMIAALGGLFLPSAVHKLFTADRWWQKIFGLCASILIAGMIIFTGSRGGFLGLVAGCFYLLLTSPKRIWLGICYSLVLLAVIPLLSADYVDRLSTIDSKNPEQEYSAGSRQVLWQAGWLIFKDNPLFGAGLLNFAQAKAPYRYHPEVTRRFDWRLLNYSFLEYKTGHGTWFQVLSEGGLFLAIPFFWLLASFFWRVRKLLWVGPPATEETRPLHDTLIGLEAGLFGFCVCMTFLDALFSPFYPIQIMLGVGIARIIDKMTKMATPTIN